MRSTAWEVVSAGAVVCVVNVIWDVALQAKRLERLDRRLLKLDERNDETRRAESTIFEHDMPEYRGVTISMSSVRVGVCGLIWSTAGACRGLAG